MKAFFLGILFSALAALVIGAALVLGGGISVAADEAHHPVILSLLEVARERSIDRRADDIAVPNDLDDTERVRKGAGNYAAMCAECHLSPGVEHSEIRQGLYPTPPDLTRDDDDEEEDAPGLKPAEAFWVIKHGIKASGMPAWGRGGMDDQDIWNLVAFIQAMPAMGVAEYRAWVATSDGHSHGGQAADSHSDMHESSMHAHDEATTDEHTHEDETPHGH